MQLGRYQVLKQIATGDVATVHLARASGLEGFARHVVLKAIRPELASEQRLVESFLEEARIAAALHHHNIVQVHDIGEQDGAYFFAMEYVHGEDVRKLLGKVRERGEQVPLEHVIAIVTATAAGLHHAHEQRSPSGQPLGLVHRDVCPANILLGYDGSVKLVDFGMAKAGLNSAKTASGALKSKASYMSPEQCIGRDVDRRTDTFALGIVLYELLTARRLYKGTNEYLTMTAIVEGEVPPPSTHRADLPKALDEIALRALARAPEARYQTAEDLREALERFAIGHELRNSNKALADYMIALFGQRPEPWHTDVEPPTTAEKYDIANDSGLVAAPVVDDLITREAPRASAPIMLAQTLRDGADVDDGWDEVEPPTTTLPEQTATTTPERPANKLVEPAAAATSEPAAPGGEPATATGTPAATTAAEPATKGDEPATKLDEPAATAVVEPLIVPVGEAAATTVGEPVTEAASKPAATTVAGPPAAARDTATPALPLAAEPAQPPDLEPTRNERRRSSPVVPIVSIAPIVPSAPIVPIVDEPTGTEPGPDERTSSVAAADDPDAATIVGPPMFIHEDSTVQRDPAELAAERAAARAAAIGDDVATFDSTRRGPTEPTLAMPPVVDDEPPPLGDEPSLTGPPPRPLSEHMYIGPPAPPASPVAAVRRLVSTYRSVLVAGGAALVVLVTALLAMRACG